MKYLLNFLEQINEGLIKSTPVPSFINNLTNIFDASPYIANINLDSTMQVELILDYVNKIIHIDNLFDLISIECNIHGYFINKVYITNIFDQSNSYQFTDDIIKYIKEQRTSLKEVKFIMEATFNIVNYLPKKLYHLSIKSHEKKILKNGLVPRSNSKLAYHPPRIYLSDDPLKSEKLITKMRALYFPQQANNGKYKKYDFIIFEIDTTELDIKLYTDPNSEGYYTQGNIPPKHIAIFKQIPF